jgi:hypothetical protein
MLLSVLLSLAGCVVAPAPLSPPLRAVSSDSLRALYGSGRTWQQFFDAAKARKEMWTGNYARGEPAAELVARAQAVPGRWRVLAVAEDWCGDSANTIPYLARLIERVPTLELAIVDSKAGRWVMEQHRTPDGRAATPTVLLLDQEFAERGCFVERPRKLRAWVAEQKPKLSDDEFQTRKMAWYREDTGRETVAELVELLESAARGDSVCEAERR